MASKAKRHVAEPKQQSKAVPPVPQFNHLGSFKQFKDARREWRGLCDRRVAMVNDVLDGPAHAEFVRIVERMDELAKQIVQSAGAGQGFDGVLDVAVFKGRFVYEHYDRLRTIPASGAWYLAFELCLVGDYRKRER